MVYSPMKIVFVLLLVIVPLVSYAETYPQPVGYVNDFAGVLNTTQYIYLDSMLTELERNTTAEIAVVTVESASDPFSYSVGLFQAWGIGKKANDNGILILYAKTQNRIEVRTGYGIEGILPDSKVGRILDDYYVPMRDSGLVVEGIVAATDQLANVVYANADEVRAGKAGMPEIPIVPILWIIIIFISLFVVTLYKRTPKCPVDKIPMNMIKKERAFGSMVTVYYKCRICGRTAQRKRNMYFFVIVGSGRSGGSGGGFGGGGFGGGGTGGGGAGR